MAISTPILAPVRDELARSRDVLLHGAVVSALAAARTGVLDEQIAALATLRLEAELDGDDALKVTMGGLLRVAVTVRAYRNVCDQLDAVAEECIRTNRNVRASSGQRKLDAEVAYRAMCHRRDGMNDRWRKIVESLDGWYMLDQSGIAD